ncbi:MAG: hypothetical protein HKN33_13570 [Pyrinomonadaceae bacterium]|nr:hypothetical protein [Pyrinomonadaceae bacterium]
MKGVKGDIETENGQFVSLGEASCSLKRKKVAKCAKVAKKIEPNVRNPEFRKSAEGAAGA